MIDTQNRKLAIVTAPAAAVNNAMVSTTPVDTLGFSFCTVGLAIGAIDIAFTALKMQHSDTSGSGYEDIGGLDFSTGNDIDGSAAALPTADDDNTFFLFEIDLRGKKRYLDLVATIGNGSTGAFVTIWAELSRAEESPVTKSERGLAGCLRA